MENEFDNYEVLEIENVSAELIHMDATERANVDSQVATAKRYPRTLKRSVDNSIVMATLDYETAKACNYALPRAGKPITGPPVHLAKIIVSNWGNMRTEAKVVQITDKQIISRGTCWDLENNVASAFEVRRSIVNKEGVRFSDDMITVTGNAANAIAYRNAVFAIVPKPIVDKVLKAAIGVITGDLSDDTKLLKARDKIINRFKNIHGLTEHDLLKFVGKNVITAINSEQIATLIGIDQSLKDGDTTVEI